MFSYLSKKLEMPNGADVKCISWSGNDGYLACGCENGLLKVLKIDSAQPTINSETTTSSPAIPRGILAAPTNISMNQTLEGHSTAIQVIAWNNVHQKLTTSDTKGLIIVWMLYKGSWYEEMVNNRNRSTVRGLAWSSDGSKICIVYEDGGVIVGSADGNRLWGKDIPGPSLLTGVSWSPDAKTILFTLSSGEIHIYDSTGCYTGKLSMENIPNQETEEGMEPVVAVKWHGTKTSEGEIGTLAIIWRHAFSLFENTMDKEPRNIEVDLTITCGDWSPNDLYIALGGGPKFISNNNGAHEQVQIFSEHGKLLQILKIPGAPCTSLTWDAMSLRLAVGAGAQIYFANLRPLYKIVYFGSGIFAYGFTKKNGSNHICLWDKEKLYTQEVSGKLLDLKGNEEYCAILSKSASSSYNVSVLNAVGAPVDSLTVLNIEPFTIALTESVIICLASNGVLIWKYRQASSQSNVDIGGGRRRERTFHIDSIPDSERDDNDSSSSKDMKKPTKDPAICIDAVTQLFIIGRESGKYRVYSLPHGYMLYEMDLIYELGLKPARLWLNVDGSQFAVVDSNGHLGICLLGKSAIAQPVVKKYEEKKDVWSLIWSRENPNLLCVMEKTRMYVMRYGETEEPVLSSGYLLYFKDLKVTSILMDELMQDPEVPSQDYVITFETRSLRDTQNMIKDNASLDNVVSYVRENNHTVLWRLLAQAALDQLNLPVAETAFVQCKDYAGVQLTKRIGTIPHELVRKAEVASFFGDLEKAEKLYLEADRRDLSTEMWTLLGEWKRVQSMSAPSTRQRPSDKALNEMNLAMGDHHAEQQQWNEAMTYYEKTDNYDRLVECYLMLEEYNKLEELAAKLPESSKLLPKIATAFQAVGLVNEAVKIYLACGHPEKAVDTAIFLSQWNLAMQLAQKNSLKSVGPVLLQYTNHLLEAGEIMQAVELLRKSDKPIAAGKLLAMFALKELQEEEILKPIRLKKLFILSAMMFTQKTKKLYREKSRGHSSGIKPSSSATTQELDNDETDIAFNKYIPKDYIPSYEQFKWLAEDPWRGVEAIHFYALTQRLIYAGQYGNGTKCALHLRDFEDILGEERVYSLIALAAANNKSFGISSRAFIQLESIDEEYSQIASDLFSDHHPKDLRLHKIDCQSCGVSVLDTATTCPNCKCKFPICSITGRPLMDPVTVWTCTICHRHADLKEFTVRKACPVCHANLALV